MPPLPPPDPPLSDGVVLLRGWLETDVPQLVEACADPEIARWTAVADPYTEELAREWVAGVWSGARGEPPGERVSVAVTEAADPARLSGSMGLMRIERGALGEIGYWTSPWARGRGVTTRAVRLLAAYGFEQFDLRRVEMAIAVDNAPSNRVAERAGFTREGV